MQYRADKNGHPISVLGYGCMRFTQKAGRIDLKKAEAELLALIDEHIARTGSAKAARIKADWINQRPRFVQVVPVRS